MMMASRLVPARAQAVSRQAIPAARYFRSPFHSTSRLFQDTAPIKRPIGAFRGGIFGFLLGTSLAGASVYYYILEEYRVSNQLLSEDIYALQASVQRTHAYMTELENKVAQQGSKN